MTTGRPPASSATCSAPGKPRALPPAPTHKPTVSVQPAATDPLLGRRGGGRAAHDRSSRTHQGRLGRVLERADRLGAGRFRARHGGRRSPSPATPAASARGTQHLRPSRGPDQYSGTLHRRKTPRLVPTQCRPNAPRTAQSADEGGQSAITGTRALGVPNRRRNRAAACERRPARRSRRTPRRARCESA